MARSALPHWLLQRTVASQGPARPEVICSARLLAIWRLASGLSLLGLATLAANICPRSWWTTLSGPGPVNSHREKNGQRDVLESAGCTRPRMRLTLLAWPIFKWPSQARKMTKSQKRSGTIVSGRSIIFLYTALSFADSHGGIAQAALFVRASDERSFPLRTKPRTNLTAGFAGSDQ